MFKPKEEMSIAEIHENLGIMGFGIPLENLAKMKPTELKKFYKKAKKVYKVAMELEAEVNRRAELLNKVEG